MILSEKDRQAIEKFRGDMLAMRRELREVKRELRKDIDRLDGWLKFVNIAAVPLLIGVGGDRLGGRHRRRAHAALPATRGRASHEAEALRRPRRSITVFAVALAITTYAANNTWSQARCRARACSPARHPAGRSPPSRCGRATRCSPWRATRTAWGLKERGGYPGQGRRVRTLLVALAEADLVEGKTRMTDRYAPARAGGPRGQGRQVAPGAPARRQGQRAGRGVVGKKRVDAFGSGKAGTYVRKPGDAQTWLANAELDVSLAVSDWVQTAVFDLGERQGRQGHRRDSGRAAAEDRARGRRPRSTPSPASPTARS